MIDALGCMSPYQEALESSQYSDLKNLANEDYSVFLTQPYTDCRYLDEGETTVHFIFKTLIGLFPEIFKELVHFLANSRSWKAWFSKLYIQDFHFCF